MYVSKIVVFCSGLVGLLMLGESTSAFAARSVENCRASWYGPGFHGRTMADGKKYDMHNPTTVAHKKLRFGTKVRITNKQNGKSIIAIVRDRGPFISGRCVDLSKAGAAKIGMLHSGTARVRVEVLN